MFVRIGFDLQYDVPGVTPMLLMLHLHPDFSPRLQRPEQLIIEPAAVANRNFIDTFGNVATRVVAQQGKVRFWADNVIEDTGELEPTIDGAKLHTIEELPDNAIRFLLASRYCEVDRMSQMAWDLFGKTPATWERVAAVLEWVHNHIEFGYPFARSTKTAMDVCTEKKGVCRDFQHLAITLLRALNVPARYCTGYLGDIGVPLNPTPMDFSAWLEVYLGDRWYALDGRHNTPRIARILMARGRDATDVAISTTFGPAKLEKFTVWTDEVGPEAIDQPPGVPSNVQVVTLV
jgi:transglutaminase-like putative cysteine protease